MSAVERVRTRAVVGERELVRSALERALADGRLIGISGLQEFADGRVQATVQVREVVWSRGWGEPSPVLRGLAVAAVVAAFLAALVVLVLAVVAWVLAHLVLLIVGAVAVLLLLGGAGAKCAGIHCGGCRG